MNEDVMKQYSDTLGFFIQNSEKCLQYLKETKVAFDGLHRAQEYQCLFELKHLREDFNILLEHLEKLGVPKPDMNGEKLERLKSLLNSPEWPIAISPDYIVETVEGKQVRARQILDLIVTEPLNGLKFLDYGCGEGFVTTEAHNRACTALGYDIKNRWNDGVDNVTTEFAKVLSGAPYDVVLLYDVLDHCEKPVEELCRIRDLLSTRGKVYVRMHPWCGKHGGHLYEKINKSHAHVIFNEEEQLSLFGIAPFIQKVTSPVSTYRNWILTSGFSIIQESVIRDPDLDHFFTNMDNIHIQERIAAHWGGVDPRKDLTTNFVNYVLEQNQSHKQIL